ncbi:FG-GAP repeat protein [Planctomycetes bacterium Pla86]|uniref:Probable pectate lyase C n=1 Tax=Engelhardtia mirabilis TaxID=2528011 RepID=A0A518BG97_9BACT|nr:FG-GAP repeat protein [Planctomycetes bacterium Pla133]QDV00317.1 FG-GAP repeat protein [Planctomycetes bacterium Pla86]
MHGAEVLDGLGSAVQLLPDLNGDGRADFAVGAPQPDRFAAGYVEVHSGALGTELFRIDGPAWSGPMGDRFGAALAVLGDLDGDGLPELAVGAPEDDDAGLESGAVSIHSGADGALLQRVAGLQAGERFGAVLASVGDVNGDGLDDLLVAAPGGHLHPGAAPGRVELLSGAWIAQTVAGQPTSGPAALLDVAGPAGFGWAIGPVGDIGGDGSIDLAVGSPGAGAGGEVVLIDGGTGAELARLFSPLAGARLGEALADAGDVAGGREPELLVGAPGHGGLGRVRLVDGGVLVGLSGSVDIDSLAVLRTHDGAFAGERFGSRLASGGDLDADGIVDYVVAACDGALTQGGGRAAAYSGQSGALLFELAGSQSGELAGWSLALGGDVDGDGHGDLVVGLPRAQTWRGAAVVLSGGEATLVSDSHLLALDAGGSVGFELWGGPALAADFYVLVGSLSGTSPGTPIAGVVLPIVVDTYTLYSLAAPPEQSGFIGVLDAAGRGSATIVLPPNTPPALAGATLHYAWLAVDGAPGLPGSHASNPVPLSLSIDSCAVLDPQLDCNTNGQLDACDLLQGLELDCNDNGVPDSCELAAGTAVDADFDGLIDACQSVVFVDGDATGVADGSSWAHAYNDLSQALAAVPEFGQVWVAEGVYRPGPVGSAPETTFSLREHVGLYGGFAGGESSLAQRDSQANPTILDGDLAADDGTLGGTLIENVWSVVTAPASVDRFAVLDGFTVRRGAADESAECDPVVAMFDKCRGAGLYCLGAPTVRDCVFEDHFAAYNGGALYVAADALFVNCTVRRSVALRGGAAYVDIGAAPTFVNCRLVGNQAYEGGALFANGNPGQGPMLVSCVVHGNGAATRAGGLFVTGGQVTLAGCTVTHNSCLGPLAGVGGDFGGTWQIDGSILWGNVGLFGSSNLGGEGAQLDGSGVTIARSCVEGWSGALGGTGNIGTDPLLADPDGVDGVLGTADDDVSLLAGSPCIDAGDGPVLGLDWHDLDLDGIILESMPFDAAGNARFVDAPSAPNSGLPLLGKVPDMGALERQN